MGLGGYLTWTPVAREISKRLNGIKVLPYEARGNIMKVIRSPIFYNNPHFVQENDTLDYFFPMCLNDPNTNYCKKDTPQYALQRHDKHISQQICEFYGIDLQDTSCEIFLTDDDREYSENILKDVSKKFITIDPHTKDEYTVNKRYSFEKWQEVVDSLYEKIEIVQIGEKTDAVLDKCTNLSGKTSFRQAGAIIEKAVLHVGSEGGLMHLSKAVNTKSVIVITGFLHPAMTCYSSNSNLWIGKPHGPCGMKILCEKCQEEISDHDPQLIVKSILEILGE